MAAAGSNATPITAVTVRANRAVGRHGHLAPARWSVDLAGGGQLLGDLEPGVAATHDQDRPHRQGLRVAVIGAVDLGDGGSSLLAGGGLKGTLERAGGHHHLAGVEGLVGGADLELFAYRPQARDSGVKPDREIEGSRVGPQVVGDRSLVG